MAANVCRCFFKFAKKASTTTNLDDLLQLLVEESKKVLNADRATVFLRR